MSLRERRLRWPFSTNGSEEPKQEKPALTVQDIERLLGLRRAPSGLVILKIEDVDYALLPAKDVARLLRIADAMDALVSDLDPGPGPFGPR